MFNSKHYRDSNYIVVVMKDKDTVERVWTPCECLEGANLEKCIMETQEPKEQFEVMFWGKRTNEYHRSSFVPNATSKAVR